MVHQKVQDVHSHVGGFAVEKEEAVVVVLLHGFADLKGVGHGLISKKMMKSKEVEIFIIVSN